MIAMSTFVRSFLGVKICFKNKLCVVSKAWEDLGDCDVAFLFSFRLLVFEKTVQDYSLYLAIKVALTDIIFE